MSDIILRVENVSKRFAGRVALDSVSIDVARGSVTGVIGPNGSGKSTLFNIIAGTLRPDRGRVLVDGRDITLASAAEICGLGVARTFQISRLFAEMTVLENLIAVARGSDDRAAIALALELLDFLEIDDIADRWGSELSYGQRKLVEIARADASAENHVARRAVRRHQSAPAKPHCRASQGALRQGHHRVLHRSRDAHRAEGVRSGLRPCRGTPDRARRHPDRPQRRQGAASLFLK
jgi:ABC-type uncharacterized transport system YnjBCD ATPase subunit